MALTILILPLFVSFIAFAVVPLTMTVLYNELAQFQCQASSSQNVVSLEWYNGETAFMGTGVIPVTNLGVGANSFLSVSTTQLSLNGILVSCEIVTNVNTTYRTDYAQLNIKG